MLLQAKDVQMAKGMEITVHVKSPYGSKYDSVENLTIDRTRKYKRGTKVYFTHELGYGGSFWQEEYPHKVEIN